MAGLMAAGRRYFPIKAIEPPEFAQHHSHNNKGFCKLHPYPILFPRGDESKIQRDHEQSQHAIVGAYLGSLARELNSYRNFGRALDQFCV